MYPAFYQYLIETVGCGKVYIFFHILGPQLVGRLALAAGLIPEYAPVTPRQLLPYFAWDKLPRRDFVFEL